MRRGPDFHAAGAPPEAMDPCGSLFHVKHQVGAQRIPDEGRMPQSRRPGMLVFLAT